MRRSSKVLQPVSRPRRIKNDIASENDTRRHLGACAFRLGSDSKGDLTPCCFRGQGEVRPNLRRPTPLRRPARSVGAVQPGDVAVLFSKGGETCELLVFVPSLKAKKVLLVTATEKRTFRPRPAKRAPNRSFSTRGVGDPGSRSRWTSWLKGLYHRGDVLVLIQELSAGTDTWRRLGRQRELELLEQDFVIGFWVGVAA